MTPPIRTITLFRDLAGPDDPQLAGSLRFLRKARDRFVAAGSVVQTIRVALRIRGLRPDSDGLSRVQAIDRRVSEAGAMWTPGPGVAAEDPAAFPAWAANAIGRTSAMFLSVDIAPLASGVDRAGVETAAAAIERLAASTPKGEGNFRFAAAARCPPGIPFFPVARHDGEPAMAMSFESAALVEQVFASRPDDPVSALRTVLSSALAPFAAIGQELAAGGGFRWLGIDTSAAPGLDASIGGAIEAITGVPFGSAGTLAACAGTTAALQSIDVERCGYCGLMLPVLEDRILAARAAEGAFDLQELLLYSSVCGIGLDMVPLAGTTALADLVRVLSDVAALATKLSKPLSARLLPVAGTKPGDDSAFDNPLLVNTRVFEVR